MVYQGIKLPDFRQDPLGVDLGGASAYAAGRELALQQAWDKRGSLLTGAAAGIASIGKFFSQQLETLQAETAAMKSEFKASAFDRAASAELERVHLITEKTKEDISFRSMQSGSEKAQQRVNTARRGVLASAGSSAEVRASMELMRQIDAQTININGVRQANAARMQAQNYRSSAEAARVSAQNLRQTNRGVTPYLVSLGAGAQQYMASSAPFIT